MLFSDFDCDRLLINFRVMAFLGIAAVLSLGATLLSLSDTVFNAVRKHGPAVLSYSAVVVAIGAVLLLVAMWLFWVKCDDSPRRARIFWFFVLLLGLSCGAVPYYLFIYVPTVRRKLRGMKGAAV